MKKKYQFKYLETKEILTDFLKVHGLSKISNNFRIVVTTGGVFVFLMMSLYGDVLKGDAGSVGVFILKFLVIWAAAFAAAEVLARTVGRKLELLACVGDGETMYKKRIEKWGKASAVTLNFYADYWESIVHGDKKKFFYKNVERIIESEDIITLIAVSEEGGKRFFGFPKNGLVEAEFDEFLQYLLAKCTNVKKGIETLNIN